MYGSFFVEKGHWFRSNRSIDVCTNAKRFPYFYTFYIAQNIASGTGERYPGALEPFGS